MAAVGASGAGAALKLYLRPCLIHNRTAHYLHMSVLLMLLLLLLRLYFAML